MNTLVVRTADKSKDIIFRRHLHNTTTCMVDMEMLVIDSEGNLLYENNVSWDDSYFRSSMSVRDGAELIKAWASHLVIETTTLW